jgi:hypothetical protein
MSRCLGVIVYRSSCGDEGGQRDEVVLDTWTEF